MGKIAQGILGGVSGTVGNVVGANWKGIDYIRSKPVSVANPRTEKQVNQRNKFSAVAAFIKPNQAFIQQGFRFQQNRMTAANAASSYNLRNAITGDAPNFTVDYSAARVSQGTLTGATDANASAEGTAASFNWRDNSTHGNARPDDQAMLLVYNQDKKESIAVLDEALSRQDGSASVVLPSDYQGDTLHFYMAFKSMDGKRVSDSSYLESVVLS